MFIEELVPNGAPQRGAMSVSRSSDQDRCGTLHPAGVRLPGALRFYKHRTPLGCLQQLPWDAELG